jgi:signal transduction histidine kinase
MANERILIADDEPQIVKVCVQMLSDCGYRVRGVSSGQEAVACLEAEPYDLLVIDIRMPEVDGLTVLRWGLSLDPNLTCVVITGYATMGRVIEAMNSGARAFLLKPFGMEEFQGAIETALAQRRKEQEWQRLRAQLPILVISQTLMAEGDLEDLSNRLLEVVARQMGAERAVLMLLDGEAEGLQIVASIGLSDQDESRLMAQAVPVEDTVAEALQAREVKVWEGRDWVGPRTFLHSLVSWPAEGPLVLVPLRTGKKQVGVLALGHLSDKGRPVTLTPSDRNLLAIMSRQVAIALENARMYAVEQKRTAELGRALEQQRDLDRLKNQFIQNVSHELRTPLAMILGYAELLASGDLGELRPEQMGPVEIMVHRSYVLRDLIGNITAILENEMREPAEDLVSVPGMIWDAIKDFQVLVDQAGLTLEADVSTEVPRVVGDAEHLRRVVDNLIGNALKFTPKAGAIRIRLCRVDGGVMLQVCDTGIGIAPEHQEQIFERFYQVDGSTRRVHGGCGLGLALVKEIVERHGGNVTVESAPGLGSTFTVILPAEDETERPELEVVRASSGQ